MVKNKKDNYLEEPKEEIDLHELQIKLEKIKAYIRKTENRIQINETTLKRLREKRELMESKRLNMTMVKKPKLTKQV